MGTNDSQAGTPSPGGFDASAAGDPITVENGFGSSEFVLTVVTLALSVLTMVFHQDFSSYAQPIAMGVSAIMVVGYQISRSHRKAAASTAAGARAVALVAASMAGPVVADLQPVAMKFVPTVFGSAVALNGRGANLNGNGASGVGASRP